MYHVRVSEKGVCVARYGSIISDLGIGMVRESGGQPNTFVSGSKESRELWGSQQEVKVDNSSLGWARVSV